MTSDKFGPWKDRLLHLSYGTCSLFGVLPQEVSFRGQPQMQGGVSRFNVNFDSGAMRARFNPQDGQLYVVGLRGWQTTATRNGCLQRVRYTGAAYRAPLQLAVHPGQVVLTFGAPVDRATAEDPASWNAELWNYVWSAAYGSPEVSTIVPARAAAELGKDGKPEFSKDQMAERKHDPLAIRSVKVSADGLTVTLETPSFAPPCRCCSSTSLSQPTGRSCVGRSSIPSTRSPNSHSFGAGLRRPCGRRVPSSAQRLGRARLPRYAVSSGKPPPGPAIFIDFGVSELHRELGLFGLQLLNLARQGFEFLPFLVVKFGAYGGGVGRAFGAAGFGGGGRSAHSGAWRPRCGRARAANRCSRQRVP